MPETTPLERAIVDILFPSGDPDHQWDASTTSDIANAILEHRPDLIPDGERIDPKNATDRANIILDNVLRSIKPCP